MEKETVLLYFGSCFTSFYEKYLGPLKTKGHHALTLCPFHADKNPSLSINTENGLFNCLGCGASGDVFTFYKLKHNLNGNFPAVVEGIVRDFGISKPAEAGKRKNQRGRIVATYDYTDPAGELLFQVVRDEFKNFWQRRPNGCGGWIYSLEGVERVLYRLPEMLKAEAVYITEGEKDAETLRALEYTATTNPHGAGNWKDEFSETLAGKDIVIFADNDEPGRKHAEQVARSLYGRARSIKIVELPGLPPKGDVSDFLAQFTDPDEARERLSIIIEGTGPYKPPPGDQGPEPDQDPRPEEPRQQTTDPAPGSIRAVLTVGQFMEIETPPRRFHLDGWLKEKSIGMISSPAGYGKTGLAHGILDTVSRGGAFGPWRCDNPDPVCLVDGEMSIEDNRERFELEGLNDDRECPFYIYADSYAYQLGCNRARLTDELWQKEIKELCLDLGVKLIAFDNIASLAPGLDENQKLDWDPVNQFLIDLRFAGVSSLLIHHDNKTGGQRGTSARTDNLDYVIQLRQPADYMPEDGARFIVHFTKARVENRFLPLVADIEMQLTQDPGGRYVWTFKNVKAARKREVVRLLDEGLKNKDIAAAVGYSAGAVSKIRTWATNEGLLSKAGKLTPSGFDWLSKA